MYWEEFHDNAGNADVQGNSVEACVHVNVPEPLMDPGLECIILGGKNQLRYSLTACWQPQSLPNNLRATYHFDQDLQTNHQFSSSRHLLFTPPWPNTHTHTHTKKWCPMNHLLKERKVKELPPFVQLCTESIAFLGCASHVVSAQKP